jgi:hypothetical protein
VCYIHEEFFRLLQVLKKDSLIAHENCNCNCEFCRDGKCAEILSKEMDLYWFMHHLLCTPMKLHSGTSHNLFQPRYTVRVNKSNINILLLTFSSFLLQMPGRKLSCAPAMFSATHFWDNISMSCKQFILSR